VREDYFNFNFTEHINFKNRVKAAGTNDPDDIVMNSHFALDKYITDGKTFESWRNGTKYELKRKFLSSTPEDVFIDYYVEEPFFMSFEPLQRISRNFLFDVIEKQWLREGLWAFSEIGTATACMWDTDSTCCFLDPGDFGVLYFPTIRMVRN